MTNSTPTGSRKGRTAPKTKTIAGRKSAGKKPGAGHTAKKPAKDLSAGYNTFKNYNGHLYTGVQIGRVYHWHYDEGDWKETKVTPDLWEVSYAVMKRRVGHKAETKTIVEPIPAIIKTEGPAQPGPGMLFD